MSQTEPQETGRKAFWVKCSSCAHCWTAAYLPMAVMDFARIAKTARCPMCAATKPVVAKQSDGELQEPSP